MANVQVLIVLFLGYEVVLSLLLQVVEVHYEQGIQELRVLDLQKSKSLVYLSIVLNFKYYVLSGSMRENEGVSEVMKRK